MNEPQPARVGDDGRPTDTPVSQDDRTDTDAGGAVSAAGATTDPAADAETAAFAPASATGTPGTSTASGTSSGADGTTPTSAEADEHQAAVASWRERNTKRRKKAKKKRPWWVEVPLLLVTAFLLTFLIQTFLFKVYYVPSGSMEPTLHGVQVGGDRILVNKIVYDFRDPKPGDIVVFRGPDKWAAETNAIPGPTSVIGKIGQALGSVVGIAPPNEKDFVKRVIAVGGQTVTCCDAQGRILVDGIPLDEPYVVAGNQISFVPGVSDCTTTSNISQRCFKPVKVPDGQLWVMGDNRAGSGDSSLYCQGNRPIGECQGPIPVDNVLGKAIFVIMPVSRWHTLGDPGTDHRGG